MRNEVQNLYGEVNPKEWADMPYKEVLELKVKLAYGQLAKLNSVDLMHRDMAGMNSCLRAMKFNEDLLKELK